MTNEQHKLLHQNATYPFVRGDRVLYGRRVGWTHDGRGFGAVVIGPSGERTFWVLNERSMRINNEGPPPNPRPRVNQTITLVEHVHLPHQRVLSFAKQFLLPRR